LAILVRLPHFNCYTRSFNWCYAKWLYCFDFLSLSCFRWSWSYVRFVFGFFSYFFVKY